MIFGVANARHVQGAGAFTCGEYIAKPYVKEMGNQWLLGYFSALNMAFYKNPDIFIDFTSIDALAAAVELYCKQNPLDLVIDGTFSVYQQLVARKR